MVHVALSGSKNVRDLGGIPVEGGFVRPRLLLRGGELSSLSRRDIQTLRRDYGLSLIVDLRTPTEREEKPDVPISGADYVLIPIFREGAAGITHERSLARGEKLADRIPNLNALYAHMVSGECLDGLSRAITTIMNAAAEGRCVLFHCTEGKDRTGLVAAILLRSLGASHEKILQDYLLTNAVSARKGRRYARLVRVLRRDRLAAEKLGAVFTAREEYLASAFAAIEKEWGTFERFLEEGLGIDVNRLAVFRETVVASK